jgi:hypothetical protein
MGIFHTTLAGEFTRKLVKKQQVNSPRLLHIAVKTLGGQVIDLLVLIRHLRDKLRNVNILPQATY